MTEHQLIAIEDMTIIEIQDVLIQGTVEAMTIPDITVIGAMNTATGTIEEVVNGTTKNTVVVLIDETANETVAETANIVMTEIVNTLKADTGQEVKADIDQGVDNGFFYFVLEYLRTMSMK